jgi:acyl carrier protein
MSSEVRQFVLDYLARKAPLPVARDLGGIEYFKEGYLDSMGLVKFLVEVDRRFGVELTEDDLLRPEVTTVDGLCRVIEGRITR